MYSTVETCRRICEKLIENQQQHSYVGGGGKVVAGSLFAIALHI